MKKIFPFVIAAVLLISCGVFFNSCQKEYSYEGGPATGNAGGTAIYTFNGTGGICTGSAVYGNYYAGNTLTAGDTVKLQVIVDSAGTYSLATTNTNGIQFSGTGTFINTGLQTITLTGTGIPAAMGNYNFTTPKDSICSFAVTVTKAPVAIASFTIDCPNSVLTGDYNPGVPLTSSNKISIPVNVASPGAYTLSTDTLNGISFSTSGQFTSYGVQTVILPGSGTPQYAQNLTFTLTTDSSSCTFPLSVLPPQPYATYVLESGFGNPQPCNYTVEGVYASNTPLTTTNTVSIQVYVTDINNYAVSTETSNGITFSASGSFTTTGAQNVILVGRGTPKTSGTFTFTPTIVGPAPLGGEACAFSIPVN